MRTLAAPCAFGLVLALGMSSARAQSPAVNAGGPERAIAEGLFQDGRSLLTAGKIAEACRKFAASYRIDPAGGTLMNLASCHEREGRIATAWAEFKDALVAAVRSNNRVRTDEARERINALERRLPRITLLSPPGTPTPGVEVRLDNVILDADGRSALPVDPGPHTVTATAPGRRPWRADVVTNEGATLTVTLGPLELASSSPLVTAPVDAALPPVVDRSPRAPEPLPVQHGASWQTPTGVVALGLGGAGLILGAVTGGLVLAQHGTLATACKNGHCPSSEASDLDSYHLKSTLSTVGFIAGGVLAATGVVILVTAPKASTTATGLFVGPASAGMRGSF